MKNLLIVIAGLAIISCSTKQDIVTDDNVKKISFRFNKNIRNDEPLKMSQLYDSVRCRTNCTYWRGYRALFRR